jgi:hypothetical protein
MPNWHGDVAISNFTTSRLPHEDVSTYFQRSREVESRHGASMHDPRAFHSWGLGLRPRDSCL